MMTLFSVRMPDGTELGWLYALHRGSAEAFTTDELSDQYGDGLLLVEVQRLTVREARDDLSVRKRSGLELWWLGQP